MVHSLQPKMLTMTVTTGQIALSNSMEHGGTNPVIIPI
jgi:hypothetical protein